MARAFKVTSNQGQILQALARTSDGASKVELEKRLNFGMGPSNLGCPSDANATSNSSTNGDTHTSLVALGYVRPYERIDSNDKRFVQYKITPKGEKLAKSVSFKKARDASSKVPAEVLDKAVITIRPFKTYGLEQYTDDDIKEIRTLLGDDYAAIPLTDLRALIINRRKQGAYVDPKAREAAAAKATLKAFGDTGTVLKGLLTTVQVQKLAKLAGGTP